MIDYKIKNYLLCQIVPPEIARIVLTYTNEKVVKKQRCKSLSIKIHKRDKHFQKYFFRI